MKSFAIALQRIKATDFLSAFGLALCLLTCGLFVCNQYLALKALDSYYRINTPALCLLFGFISACCNLRIALMGCVLALPLLPTFAWQFQLYTGYGRIQDVHGAGFDLATGIALGVIARAMWHKQKLRDAIWLPWSGGLVLLILTISVAVAIMRNLHQTSSPFVLQALLYNLLHLRTLGWHDDYRPLLDLAAYCSAFSLLAVFTPALKAMPDRNDVIFKPLIIGLVIAALVGWRQSAFGAALTLDQLNFRVDRFGYMALGFQPDIHAFGAHMLIGVVGLLGYLYYKNNVWLRVLVISLVIPLCWVVLFLSKSKSTFAVSILLILALAILWAVRRAKYTRHFLYGVLLIGGLVALSIPIFTESWAGAMHSLMKKFDIPDWLALNLKLSYRPEVYLAAFKMFALYPFAGLGQSEFYHQSAIYDLTQSYFLSIQQNGENAHNYFLQTLVENGVLGISVFLLLVAYPLLKANNLRTMMPGIVALVAVFGGNLFSHSLLVRENLLLAAIFLSLMYASATKDHPGLLAEGSTSGRDQTASRNIFETISRYLNTHPTILIILIAASFILIVKEARQSLTAMPFTQDKQCSETRPLERDGWTSGRFIVDVPFGARGATLNLATTQPNVVRQPLSVSLLMWFDQRFLAQKDFVLNKTGPQSIEIALPEGKLATPDDYQIELKLQRCFVPRNFGMSGDGRRLGIRVESIDWH